MGAWGIDFFEDDEALDLLDEINDMDDLEEFMDDVFTNGLDLTYLEYDDGMSVLVCAALIDWKLNKTNYEILIEDYEELLEIIEESEIDLYRDKAVEALKMILSDRSELHEVWKQNQEEYPKWKQSVQKLIDRL